MNSRYLDLLRQVLTRSLFIDHPQQKEIRRLGRDWPLEAETMIGEERLQNVWDLASSILGYESGVCGVPGDFMECGVWRGGAAIFMAGILAAYGDAEGEYWADQRSVWVADSFQGLPAPNAVQFPADLSDKHHEQKRLAIPQAEVKANFKRYGLLDDRVKFLPGFFKDSLPGPVKQLALLRIDADMYESTWQCLDKMYPLLSPGGFVIIDDYHAIKQAQLATDAYRKREGIESPMTNVNCAVYWRKE